MKTQRWSAAAGLAMTLLMSACLCNADEEHAVTVSAPDSLTVTRDGVARRVEFVTRLTENEVAPSAFQFVFNTIEGSRSGEGIALTLSSTGQSSNELVLLVLALPVSLNRGDQYVVGRTFAVEPGFNPDPQLWGPRDLQQSNQAEVAFTVSTYSFPPALFTVNFRAVTSTGTIRVIERERGRLEMSVNLTLTDATGKTATVVGRVNANSESYTPPCT